MTTAAFETLVALVTFNVMSRVAEPFEVVEARVRRDITMHRDESVTAQSINDVAERVIRDFLCRR